MSTTGLSWRALMRGATLSVPVLSVVLAAPGAVAAPIEQCNEPSATVENS